MKLGRLCAGGLAAASLGLMIVMLTSAPAHAHSSDESYLYLEVTTGDLRGRVELSFDDLREVFDLELAESRQAVLTELESSLPQLHEYIAVHTAVGATGTAWRLTFEGVELLGETIGSDGFGFGVFPFVADVPGGAVPRELDVTFDPFFDETDTRAAVVVLGNDWQRGVFEEESNRLVVLNRAMRSATVDLGSASQWKNFTASIRLGVDHIRSGVDHIFFVLVLLLPAVLVLPPNWRPAPTFGNALWRVLKIVTMFTLAHSITFTLAGLELFPLPPARAIEVVIALSIAAAALHNLKPVLQDREWLVAFAFGLFHGMGFALVVESIEVDRATRLFSLLGRNLGIEIGQAAIILLVFPGLYLLRRTQYYRPVFVLGSLAFAAFSLAWMIERALLVDLPIDWLTSPLTGWPLALIALIAAAATLGAAAVYRAEARAGRLLRTDSAHSPGLAFATNS